MSDQQVVEEIRRNLKIPRSNEIALHQNLPNMAKAVLGGKFMAECAQETSKASGKLGG